MCDRPSTEPKPPPAGSCLMFSLMSSVAPLCFLCLSSRTHRSARLVVVDHETHAKERRRGDSSELMSGVAPTMAHFEEILGQADGAEDKTVSLERHWPTWIHWDDVDLGIGRVLQVDQDSGAIHRRRRR